MRRLLLLLLVSLTGHTFAASQALVQLPGIPGESGIAGFTNFVEIIEYQVGGNTPVIFSPTGTPGRFTGQEARLKLSLPYGFPDLQTLLAYRSAHSMDLLFLANTDTTPFTLQSLQFTGVYYTEASTSIEPGDDQVCATLRFQFEELSWSTFTPNQTGGVEVTTTVDLNIPFNTYILTFSNPDDLDGDGMPNQWETDNGLDPTSSGDKFGDLDGDFFVNLFEYRADTSPTNANEFLHIQQTTFPATNTTHFTWSSEPGLQYLLQSNTNTGPGWVTQAVIPASGTGTTSTTLTNLPANTMFFRVALDESAP